MTSKTYLKNVPVFSDIEMAEKYSIREEKSFIHKRVKPIKKYCTQCKVKRVKHHHFTCNECWKKLHMTEQEKRIENVKNF